MSLTDISLKLSYNSGDNDLVSEFYMPCFKNSIRYDRAVGFFTSKILSVISKGLNEFLLNDGRMKLICSPKFNEEDIKAIEKGYEDRSNLIQKALIREIGQIPDDIVNDSLNCLSWLIATSRLDIKVALPRNISLENYGIYHEKIGVFYDDDNNVVAFSGSHNETLYGISYNYESFDVYRSWVENERCNSKVNHFNKLWENNASGIEIYCFPEAAKKRIIEKVVPQTYSEINGNYTYINIERRINSKSFLNGLWYFQKEAIKNWKSNSFLGMFSMATGTGKTKTAIGGIIELKKLTNKIFTVIACPQNTIIKQWESEIDSVELFKNSVIADSTNSKWQNELANLIIDYNDEHINNCVVYTTYNTLSGEKFTKIISELNELSLLICDEVHWAGAETFRKGLLPVFKYRLGLSATPSRYMDEEGTDEITSYFNRVVYEFSLERALKEINPITDETFLCPYNYYPLFIPLNEDELIEYYELTEKIKRQYAKEIEKEEKSDFLQRLYEKRQAIIVNARAKYGALDGLLQELRTMKYLLVYCSPQQIDAVQDTLNKKSIINHRFTGQEDTRPKKEYNNKSERDYILSNFENGNYHALVAMKCLDEGVNILRAEVGIFMASSGNPKQFIQRRGRLLRRHPNKKIAKIYDIFVVPFLDKSKAKDISAIERNILRKELRRYEEFASLADNKLEATNTIFRIKEIYDFYW